MAQMEDVARLRLEILGDEAERTVDSLKEGLGDVNAQLRLMETNGKKGSDEWRELKDLQKDINVEMLKTARSIDVNTASINDLNKAKRVLTQDIKKLEIGSKEWLEKMDQLEPINRKLNETNAEMRNLGREVKEQDGFWMKFKANFTAAFAFEMVKQAGSAIYDFGRQVFDITAKFEKYEAVLGHALGSQSAAVAAMQDIKDLASTTPFSVDELTDSYVKYVNRGLQPSMKEMKAMADVAAVSGKSFDQLAEALMDGATGQNERFKELSIGAKSMGDQVQLSFKGTEITVDKSLDGMNQAMVYFQENAEGVMGATDIISATLSGTVNNLGDAFDELQLAIGEQLKPVFLWLLGGLASGIEYALMFLKAIVAIPSFIRDNIGIITGLVVAIVSLNTANIAAAASALAHAAAEKGRVIATESAVIAQRLLNLVMSANPIGILIAAVSLLVGAFVTMYQNSERVRVGFYALWEVVKVVGQTIATVLKGIATANYASVIDALKNVGNKAGDAFNDSYKKKMHDLKMTRIKETLAAIDAAKGNGKKEGAAFGESFKAPVIKAHKDVTKSNKTELDKQAADNKKAADEAEKLRLATEKDTAALFKRLDIMATNAIEDDLTRNKVHLMQKFEAEIEALDEKHLSKESYALLEKELKAELIKDIEALDDKAAAETKKKDDERLESIKLAEFATKKAILESEILNEKLTINEKLRLGRELREIEYKETIRLIEAKALIAKSREGITAAEINAINAKLFADKTLAATIFQKDVAAIDAKMVAEKKDIFSALKNAFKALLDGDKEALKDFTNIAVNLAGSLLNAIERNVDRQMQSATTATERAALEMKKAWISVGHQALDVVAKIPQAMATGDWLGVAMGAASVVISVVDNIFNGAKKRAKAYAEDLKVYLREAGDAFIEFASNYADLFDLEKINSAYSKLVQISELEPPKRWDLFTDGVDDMFNYELHIENELKIGKYANDNYEKKKKLEDDYNKQIIANIEAAYSVEVRRINDKYDLLSSLADTEFTAETAKIRELQGQRLLELVANEQEKTAILAEYAEKRNQILAAFALADQAITEETDQATITAINAARDARTTALAELQGKLNTELEYIINSEDGKRKELTETEKITKEAEESIEKLRFEKKAADILREKEKNAELVAAEQVKNDLLTAEADRYNGELVRLGTERDAILAESFEQLKQLMKAGYDEIIKKAQEALDAGKITANEYQDIINKWTALKNLIGEVKAEGAPGIPNFDFDWNFTVPRFESGGFIPEGPSHSQGGIKLWNDKTKMFQGEIEGGEPILSKLTYANNKPLVDRLLHSSIHRNGASIRTDGGPYVNYLQAGHYASGGIIGGKVDFSEPASSRTIDTMNRMTAATERAADTLREIAAIQRTANETLTGIREKPSGISLHEINSAAMAQADVRRKADL
jgi:hypothetical protein